MGQNYQKFLVPTTLEQNPNFYPNITSKELDVRKCKFFEKWDFEIVNSVINDTLNM